MKTLINYMLAISSLVTLGNSQESCPEGWVKWRDEKCFLLISKYSTYQDAKQACSQNSGLLANVMEEEQQQFLQDYIFNTSAIDIGVWIGATRVSAQEFQWENGKELNYTNWTPGSPTEVDGRDCVMMLSQFSKLNEGTWRDVSCSTPNYLVCERIPTWSPEETQKILIETRKKLDNLLANPVPIGFIYTQYPGKDEPSKMFPLVQWKEVTSEYAGKFFRALGGDSAAFGVTQSANSSRIISVRYSDGSDRDRYTQIDLPAQGWSSGVTSGTYHSGSEYRSLSFFATNPENRPINTAIRIWAREA